MRVRRAAVGSLGEILHRLLDTLFYSSPCTHQHPTPHNSDVLLQRLVESAGSSCHHKIGQFTTDRGRQNPQFTNRQQHLAHAHTTHSATSAHFRYQTLCLSSLTSKVHISQAVKRVRVALLRALAEKLESCLVVGLHSKTVGVKMSEVCCRVNVSGGGGLREVVQSL